MKFDGNFANIFGKSKLEMTLFANFFRFAFLCRSSETFKSRRIYASGARGWAHYALSNQYKKNQKNFLNARFDAPSLFLGRTLQDTSVKRWPSGVVLLGRNLCGQAGAAFLIPRTVHIRKNTTRIIDCDLEKLDQIFLCTETDA